jgi:hypothetical protein
VTLPTPYALPVREPVDGAPDDFGNVTRTWAERSWAVHFVSPGAMAEPGHPNRDASTIVYSVAGPKAGAPSSEHAEIKVDGEWFPVDGRPKDWTRGPWSHPSAGVVVELKRVEG